MPEVFQLDIDESKRTVSDEEALNAIAIFMGSQEQWNGGDVCEMVAETIARTGRPPVGDQTPADLRMYRKKADAIGIEHDGDEEDDEDAAERVRDHAWTCTHCGTNYEAGEDPMDTGPCPEAESDPCTPTCEACKEGEA